MSNELQEIVNMKENLGMSFSEIGKVLRMTYEQVRYRYKKAKQLEKEAPNDFEVKLVDKIQNKILFSNEMANYISEKLKENIEPIDVDNLLKYTNTVNNGYEKVEIILHITDAHVGKKTETYSTEVFKENLKAIYDDVIKVTSNLRNNFKDVVRIKVLLGGDLVDGDLLFPGHANFIDSNIYKQIANLVSELSKFLLSLTSIFSNVYVEHVYGNHGRISKFTTPKNNWDLMAYNLLQAYLQNIENIHFGKGDNWYTIVETLDNGNIFLTHGDGINMYQGIPLYGMIQSMMRWSGSITNDFKYFMIGHFHTPIMMNWNDKILMVNGCFTTSDDWALKTVKLQSSPQQRLLVISEKGIEIERMIKLT